MLLVERKADGTKRTQRNEGLAIDLNAASGDAAVGEAERAQVGRARVVVAAGVAIEGEFAALLRSTPTVTITPCTARTRRVRSAAQRLSAAAVR
jgi:hypothetical protein